MADDRAEVEVVIHIGMETDAEVLSVLAREAKRATREALDRSAGRAEYVHETQWCAGAMRITVRRQLDDDHNDPAWDVPRPLPG